MFLDRIAFQIGSLTIYWYGIFVSLGVIAGFSFMQYKAVKAKMDVDDISNVCFYAILWGIIGARLLYVILNFNEYSHNLIEIIRIDHGGLVFYGGFFGATAAAIFYIKKKKINLWEIADLFALGLPLGQVFGRVGCFINGCCFGKPSNFQFAVQYPQESIIWSTQVHKYLISAYEKECLPVLPTQIFQSGTNLVIWFILLFASCKLKQKGQLFSLYLILYSAGRFLNEFNRGDYLNYYAGLTISQVICLVIFPVGGAFFVKLNKDVAGKANVK